MNGLRIVDARRLACPQPVLLTRKEMISKKGFVVLVSQSDQVDNVSRMAQRSGWTVQADSEADHYKISLTPGSQVTEPVVESEDLTCSITGQPQKGLVVLASQVMGKGDDKLGALLMKAFLSTLVELDSLPGQILMYNSAVKLALDDSPVLETLQILVRKGVEIHVCGTCLEFFRVRDRLAVGQVSNMFDIAGAMTENGFSYIA